MDEDVDESEPAVLPASEEDLHSYAVEYLQQRGIDPGDVGVDCSAHWEPGAHLHGYLVFGDETRYTARNLLGGGRPKYLTAGGKKGSVFLVGEDDPHRPLWLCEGVFDALSLYALGCQPAAAILGAKVTDEQAYNLRKRTVFVLGDADHAGYKGARETRDKLREYDANPILLDMPPGMGKDPSEALQHHREAFSAWLEGQRAEMGATDESYVMRLFGGEEPSLKMLPTGIPTWDSYLGGGQKEGLHGIGAEPGIGKTSWALNRAVAWADAGERVLYVTYEISKRQSWARIAAKYDRRPWDLLELDPRKASKATVEQLRKLTARIRVAVGWDVGRIQHAADRFDAIIIDYLQRMPGPYSGDSVRLNVNHNIEALSNLARDKAKVVVVISSIPRSSYGDFTQKSFKESGNIEYVAQSLVGLLNSGPNLITGKMVKNTRGLNGGQWWMRTDLGHLHFEEVSKLSEIAAELHSVS